MTIAAAAIPSLTPAQRRRHWEILTFSAAVIVLSFALFIRSDGRVALFGFTDHPIPETCPARTLLHVECPGCGLTRSFISLARGDIPASWSFNRCGILLALACLWQVPYRTLSLATGRTFAPPRAGSIVGTFLIAALMVNWLVNQFIVAHVH
jgi:hypothetical protein